MSGIKLARTAKWARALGPIFLLTILACEPALAQEEEEGAAEKSASGLLIEATKKLKLEDYASAVPFLVEYLDRMEGVDDSRILAMKQKVRLKLGRLMAHMEDLEASTEYLNTYLSELPRYRPREAYRLLAADLYEIGNYQACITAVTNALARPLPQELPGQRIKYNKLSKKDLAGFSARTIERYEKENQESKSTLSVGLNESRPDQEADFTTAELVSLNMTLAESYAALENWEAAIPPYDFVIKNTSKEDRKGYAILQMVNALVGLKEFDKAEAFISQLAKTDARYDIRVNMALMTAANALFNEQQYKSALLLYRMVLPRQLLVAHQETKMNDIRREIGLPTIHVQIHTNEMGRVETKFGARSNGLTAEMGSAFANANLPAKTPALIQLEEAVHTLVALPPYEENVVYQLGRLFAAAGRPWEAVTAFDWIADKDLESERGQRAFSEALQVLSDPLKKYELVEQRALPFLEKHLDGLGPRMVALALVGCYQEQTRWDAVKQLFPIIEQFVPASDALVLQYECELYYMQAIADMVLLNYSEARDGFEVVMNRFPHSQRQESCTYWHAMSQLLLKENQKGLDEFDAYLETYPQGDWLDSVTFHRGVCLFGLERYAEAKEAFGQVMARWPNSSIYPDACSLRGDLFAAEGGNSLDLAQADYETAIHAPQTTVRQETYAVFQMVSMFDLERRYDEMLAAVNAYLDRRGEAADVAKAAYWIGKTKIEQGHLDEALQTYLEVVVKYGGTVQQDGVDMILTELVQVAKGLDSEPHQALEASVQSAIDAAESVTLQLRLRVLLAQITETTPALGKQLIAELDDLKQAPPPVLSVICDASFAQEDYSRAEDLFMLFQTHYGDSDFMRAAYKLRGFEQFKAGNWARVENIATEAQALYGTEADVVWAQLLKGRVELKTQKFADARETFRTVLGMRQWRGEPYAQACYYLGVAEEGAGDLRKAFAWYQRTYTQYKGYAQGHWAAESYLASARCLEQLGLLNEQRNTYRALLFDRYVNTTPQAEIARTALGTDEVAEIEAWLAQGNRTNLVVVLDAEESE